MNEVGVSALLMLCNYRPHETARRLAGVINVNNANERSQRVRPGHGMLTSGRETASRLAGVPKVNNVCHTRCGKADPLI
jgi:hypothetical protein